MSAIILPLKRSPLSYPGGSPGFDPSHIASRNICFSGVPSGLYPINLLNGAQKTAVSATDPVGVAVDGAIGPSIIPANAGGGSFTWLQFAGPSGTPTQGTIAAICRFTDTTNFSSAFGSGFGETVFDLQFQGGHPIAVTVGALNVASNITL